MSKSKQSVNVRLTKEANKIIAKWQRKYGGLNKSETIIGVNEQLARLEPLREVYVTEKEINFDSH